MLNIFGMAFGLGLALSAAPGALNVETLRRGTTGGFWPAFQVQMGALAGDALWVTAAVFGAAVALQHDPAATIMLALGGAVLLGNAWFVLRVSSSTAGHVSMPSRGSHNGLLLGAVLALSSPLTVAFWASAHPMISADLGRQLGTSELALLGSAYVSSVLLWGAGLSYLAVFGRRFLGTRMQRVFNRGCALLLTVWGARLLAAALWRLV